MPKQWTDKEERQYKHIKSSVKDKGKSTDKAEEIAARTVNKHRAQDGKTEQSKDYHTKASGTSQGGKNLDDRTKDQLYRMAQDLHIAHRSQMNKSQLVRAIQKNR